MSTTATQKQRLRLDLGLASGDTTNLPDATIDLIFDEAAESYSDAASQSAYTRVIALGRLLIQAAGQVDYTQNNTTERASQRYAALAKEQQRWQAILDLAVKAAGGGAVRFGKTTRRPARIQEYPGW